MSSQEPKLPTMSNKNNVAFIGARGVGKSTIARMVAQELYKTPFCMDELIQYESKGQNIENIVLSKGWKGFRDLEFQVLEKLSHCSNSIIDCGGGVLVEAPERPNREEAFSDRKFNQLKNCAKVIYLRRPLQDLVDIVELDENRPSLSNDYKLLLEKRLPWYEKAADHIVDLEQNSAEEMKDIIIQLLK